MCGTATTSVDEWKRNGNCCGICSNATYRDECTRCRAKCASIGSSRACAALAVYRATKRVAFPEKVAEAAKREADARRQEERRKNEERKKKLPEPPKVTPVPGKDGNVFSAIWRRYWANLCNFAVFAGRSSRADVMLFLVGQFVGLIATGMIGAAPLFIVATAVPTLALAVRRLHDANLSGKWLWLLLIWPLALLVLPVMLLMPGSAGNNPYGPPPE